MADEGVFCKNADILVRAGTNCDATALTTAETDKYVLDVEALICCETLRDWSTDYASLTKNTKLLLKEAGACKCAMKVIATDLSGMQLLEAQTRLDVLDEHYKHAVLLLKSQDVKDFIK